METKYNHNLYEKKWWDFWLQQGYFAADSSSTKDPYVILMPPPNVTDRLHMGHGLNNTVQDIFIRWQRMLGKEVCWLPGTDHAGIATQMMVEKSLQAEGRSRQELGREQFIARCWQWQEKHGNIIISQLQRLGASADWQRLAFTMSPSLSKAVREVFVRLFDKGLIYRGKRLVNWDCALQTAVSDDEVFNREETGKLWSIAYPLVDRQSEQDELVVATTRPETMFGDTAVAVNPNDQRYRQYIGKKVLLPLVNRELPVIADSYVKSEFGTGCLKITPAHDFNDFDIGQRHQLPALNIFDDAGLLADCVPPKFQGMTRSAARQAVLRALRELNLLRGETKHRHTLPYSDRSKELIEPRLSQQWFLRMQPLVAEAIRVAKDGELRFYPDSWQKTYLHWLENIQDWCISRQLWWGHRIPVWYCQTCQQHFAATSDPSACKHCGSKTMQQDDDVLDTWFSSWLWSFSTLGFPDHNEQDLRKFYPSQVLITGADIIFLWVARMVIAGIEVLGKPPFKDVYFNSIICDHQGRKFSKTLGNGIDPLEVIDQYGADAVRFTCVSLAPLGGRARMGKQDFANGAKFVNKLWNAARFLLAQPAPQPLPSLADTQPTVPEQWLLNSFADTVMAVDKHLQAYRVDSMADALYRFIWGTYCDWGVEIAKTMLQTTNQIPASMYYIMDGLLRLVHPVMPFISEEIWQRLPAHPDWDRPSSLVVAKFPQADVLPRYDSKALASWEMTRALITAIRTLRSRATIPPQEQIEVSIAAKRLVADEQRWLHELAGVAQVIWLTADDPKPTPALVQVGAGFEVYTTTVRIDVGREKDKLRNDQQRLTALLSKVNAKLNNPAFCANAPAQVLEEHTQRRQLLQSQLHSVEVNLQALGS
ncbi:MAG: valine--tRNA ligase [Pseudomonadota bacterium]|nr:valine--tRNA ligase [Pseudomonadota bacterium]